MNKLVAVFLATIITLFPFSVNSAEISAHFDGITITFSDTSCSNEKVLEILKPEFHDKFQDGKAVFPGNKEVALCWTTDPEVVGPVPGAAFVVDETGSFGEIPLILFTEAVKTRVETSNF
jgi:hypothetical protein